MRSGLDSTTVGLYTGSAGYDVYWRLKVANGDGTLQDLEGRYFNIDLKLPDPIEPIGSLRFKVIREYTKDGTDSSLSPTVVSDLNVLDDGTTYSPLLQIGRLVTLDCILVTKGSARPTDGDSRWYEIFRGIISRVSWPKADNNSLTVDVNGHAAILQLQKSEAAYTYDAGDSIETVVSEILTNNGLNSEFTTYFPSATGKVLTNDYAPGLQKTVWQQLRDLMQSFGWTVYVRYRGTGGPELTFFEPARSKTTPDQTVQVDDYKAIDVDEDEIRNVGFLVYTDANGQEQLIGPEVNSASITKYGGWRRPFWIKLQSDSPVRDGTAAQEMLEAALSDVADPDIVAVASTRPLVFGESGVDLYTLEDVSGRFHNTDQDWALFSNRITAAYNRDPRSSIGVRGVPTAGAKSWRDLGTRLPRDPSQIGLTAYLRSVAYTQSTAEAGFAGNVFPDSDVDNSDSWSENGAGSNLYEVLNETSFSDSDYVSSPDSLDNCPTTVDYEFTVGLANPASAPGLSIVQGMQLSYRLRRGGGNPGQADFTVQLLETSTVIAEWSHTDVGASFTQFNQTLSNAQIDSIGNHNNLRVRVVATLCQDAEPNNINGECSWIRLQYTSKAPKANGVKIDCVYDVLPEVDEIDFTLYWNDGNGETSYSYTKTLASAGQAGTERLQGPGAVDFFMRDDWTGFRVEVTPVAQPGNQAGAVKTYYIEDGDEAAPGAKFELSASGYALASIVVPGSNITTDLDGDNNVRISAASGASGDTWSDPVDADVIPDADSTRDLGTTATRFAEVWADDVYITNGLDATEINYGDGLTDIANALTLDIDGLNPVSGDSPTAVVGTDQIAISRGSTLLKTPINTMPLSEFNDDLGYVNYTASNGVQIVGSDIRVNYGSGANGLIGAAPNTPIVPAGIDAILVADGGLTGAVESVQLSTIPVGVFSNAAGTFIEDVIGGAGLAESGTSTITLSVNTADGVRVAGDNVQLDIGGLSNEAPDGADSLVFWDDTASVHKRRVISQFEVGEFANSVGYVTFALTTASNGLTSVGSDARINYGSGVNGLFGSAPTGITPNTNDAVLVGDGGVTSAAYAVQLGDLPFYNTQDGVDASAINAGSFGTGNYTITGDLSIVGAGNFLELGTNPATSNIVRLPNDQYIAWRNAANTGQLRIGLNSSDEFEVQTDWTPEVDGVHDLGTSARRWGHVYTDDITVTSGLVTSVAAAASNSGLTVSPSAGDVIVSINYGSGGDALFGGAAATGITVVGTDAILVGDGGVLGATEAVQLQSIPIGVFSNAAGTYLEPGDAVTSVSGDTGLASTGGTTPTISLDWNNLPDRTFAATDKIVFYSPSGAGHYSDIASGVPLSAFNDDIGAGSTYSGGDGITVTGGNVISIDGSSGGAGLFRTAWGNAITPVATDGIIIGDGGLTGTAEIVRLQDIDVGLFGKDGTYVEVAGDVMTGVLTISNNGGNQLRLIDNDSAGAAAISYMSFNDQSSRIGYVGFGGSGNTRLTIANEVNGTIRVNSDIDSVFEIDHGSATGSPILAFTQGGSRRSYLRHVDTGDVFRVVSEFGNLELWAGVSGTEVMRMDIDPVSATQGRTEFLNTQVWVRGRSQLSGSATATLDWDQSNFQSVLNDSSLTTIVLDDLAMEWGGVYTLEIEYATGGSSSVTWTISGTVQWQGGSPPTLPTATVGDRTIITFIPGSDGVVSAFYADAPA